MRKRVKGRRSARLRSSEVWEWGRRLAADLGQMTPGWGCAGMSNNTANDRGDRGADERRNILNPKKVFRTIPNGVGLSHAENLGRSFRSCLLALSPSCLLTRLVLLWLLGVSPAMGQDTPARHTKLFFIFFKKASHAEKPKTADRKIQEKEKKGLVVSDPQATPRCHASYPHSL